MKPKQDKPHWFEEWASEERTRYPVNTYIKIAVLTAIIAVGIVWWSKASAHDWYDISCCSGHDCRPISGIRDGEPWSEIADMGDHYLWQSSQTGETHRIEKDFRNIKPSRDGFYHGCELKQIYAQGHRVQCLYVPVMF